MSTETKFTPGPWYYRPEEPSVEAEHPNEPGFFATIADCGKSRTLNNDQMAANAQLIATTPELFGALRRLEAAVTAHQQAITIAALNELCDAQDEAKSILAKAEGGAS